MCYEASVYRSAGRNCTRLNGTRHTAYKSKGTAHLRAVPDAYIRTNPQVPCEGGSVKPLYKNVGDSPIRRVLLSIRPSASRLRLTSTSVRTAGMLQAGSYPLGLLIGLTKSAFNLEHRRSI